MTETFILFQVIIIVFFLSGAKVRQKYSAATGLSKRLININLIFIEPFIVFWSVWGLQLNLDLMVLPLAGSLLTIVGAFTGIIVIQKIRLEKIRKATFLICAGLSNHGFTMGGFLCYLLFGEKGLAMSSIFIAYFMPLIFLFVFPFARSAGWSENEIPSCLNRLKTFFLNLQNMPLYALLVVVTFKLTGLERPLVHLSLEPILFISVGLYYFSLGSNFELLDIRTAFKENILLAGIKFLVIPFVAFLGLKWLPLDVVVKQVIMIESTMPVAVYSVVCAILFDLDSRLASGLFVTNTLIFLILVIPLVMFGRAMFFAF